MNINYEFKNKELLKTALTHISLANEKGIESNQRLEFLGDSILSFVVAEYIYGEFKNLDEGKLTEVRAGAVCEKSLAKVAEKMGLGEAVVFGKSEINCNGNKKPSILCDTYEAVLGAIYLDSGLEAAKKWIMWNLKDTIEAAQHMDFKNYKSDIQSYFQKRDKNREVVTYALVSRTGPDHAPVFEVNAVYQGKIIGTGKGTNRKTAETAAAKQALERIEGKE
ncbi:MAG: ribonuclease III [Clostridia bacterium]|nr:ribonuclease III [Clostridia bacterium]